MRGAVGVAEVASTSPTIISFSPSTFFTAPHLALVLTTQPPLVPFFTGRSYDSEEEALKAANQELNHGRLAMLAVLELFRHDAQQLVGGMYAGDAVMGRMITGLPFIYGN